MNELQKTTGVKTYKQIESFVDRLHDAPIKSEIKTNPQANNSEYIPIGIIETKLDNIFAGLWQTKNFRWQVVANEVVGSIELHVFHPVIKEWITREGSGSVMIQMVKGSSVNDVSSKIKNTLVKDFPHLKSECIKNAAKSLGPAFGRALNRITDDYMPISESIENANTPQFLKALEACNSDKDLAKVWKEFPQLHSNPVALDSFINRKKEIANG